MDILTYSKTRFKGRRRSFRFLRNITSMDEGLFQVRLDKVRVNECTAGVRKRRKATVKIRRNPLLRFLPLIQKHFMHIYSLKTLLLHVFLCQKRNRIYAAVRGDEDDDTFRLKFNLYFLFQIKQLKIANFLNNYGKLVKE